LRRRLAMEAVEQQKLDSIPHVEGVLSSHRFPFGLGPMLPFSPNSTPAFSKAFNTGLSAPLTLKFRIGIKLAESSEFRYAA
jgi:hypothetical protein